MASSVLVSLSKSKLFSLPLSITRRGYAATAATERFSRGGHMNGMVGMREDRTAEIRGSNSSDGSNMWAPDPLTGYYRPANRADEIDPAELRIILLNHKVKPL